MGIKSGVTATVWKIEDKGKFTKAQISTSKKNKVTNTYETDFSGYVNFVGHAHNKVSQIKEKEKIKIGDFEVTNSYDKEKKITYTNIAVYSFETMAEANNAPSNTTPAKTTETEEDFPY